MKKEEKVFKKEYVSPFIEVIATALDGCIMLTGSLDGQLHEFEDGGEENEDDGDL